MQLKEKQVVRTQKAKGKENIIDIIDETQKDDEEIMIIEEIVNGPKKKKKKKLKPHKCIYCRKGFTNINKLNSHTKLHKKGKVLQCSQTAKDCSKIDHIKKNFKKPLGERSYQCRECGMSPVRKNDFANHYEIHSKVKLIWCSGCDKGFTQKFTYAKHRCKPEVETFQCNFCEEIFFKIAELITHTLKNNLNHPQYCNKCGESFSKEIYLKCHMRTHTGENPYQCTKCTMGFSQYTSLVSHIKAHIVVNKKSKENQSNLNDENNNTKMKTH